MPLKLCFRIFEKLNFYIVEVFTYGFFSILTHLVLTDSLPSLERLCYFLTGRIPG